ncbi:hypothetical protein BH09BAC3_BH09BAC3_13820 [soil metagenome]
MVIEDFTLLQSDLSPISINIDSSTAFTLAGRGGAGDNFEINKNFIVYFESQFLLIPRNQDIQQTSLSGLSFQIGIKSPLN